jgi:hypothetical protein
MKDIDVLVELYKEQRQLSLHHEGQRNAVTGIILTIASGLIAVIGFDKELTKLDLPVAFLVVFAGGFGAILSLKHYERFRFHRHRSRMLRKAIDAALRYSEKENDSHDLRKEIRTSLDLGPESSSDLLKAVVDKANRSYGEKDAMLSRWELNKLWAAISVLVSLIGVVLIIVILSRR